MTLGKESQLASAVLMIKPVRFQSNPLTAASNRFQGKNASSPEQQQLDSVAEFDGLRRLLEESDVNVVQFADTPEPHTPDSIFPNNWVSFHADGTVVLYPLEAPNRRAERRQDLIEQLVTEHHYQVRQIIDLSHREDHGHFLEGTGSLVLDRAHHIAYAGLSSRTHLDALGEFAQRLDYKIVAFAAIDRGGEPIYHTNVMMNVGEKLAVVCADSVADEAQRAAVLQSLRSTGHEVILLSIAQLEAFAGNMLELRSSSGERLIAMSEHALQSLDDAQLRIIEDNATIISAPIECIESSSGGSVRCMLAEIHLPATA